MENPDTNDPNRFNSEEPPPFFWHIRQAENAKDEKMIKIVIAVAIVVIIAGSAWFMFVITHMTGKNDARWSEAQSAVSVLKQAVDTYSAKYNKDLSGLDSPPGTLKAGFVSGSNLLYKLKLSDITFENFQYFDAEDFSLEFVTDGMDGQYIIIVDASYGVGGTSGVGPDEGKGVYNSATDEWTGMFQ